jgi:hypothetical protein
VVEDGDVGMRAGRLEQLDRLLAHAARHVPVTQGKGGKRYTWDDWQMSTATSSMRLPKQRLARTMKRTITSCARRVRNASSFIRSSKKNSMRSRVPRAVPRTLPRFPISIRPFRIV